MSFDWIHALFGLILGLFAGLYLYSDLFPSPHAWLAIPLTAATLALLAGRYTDTFWQRAAQFCRWW
ncbi:MAG: hypothetical protein ACTHN5_06970 [Phycisphaerae bacterium]